MHGENSGLTNGFGNNSQLSLEQEKYTSEEIDIEKEVEEQYKDYIEIILPQSSPIPIPTNSLIKDEQKNGYHQVKYEWAKDEYKYTARWHTRTPNAPINQEDTWVIERKISGIGSGQNARKKFVEILIHTNNKEGHKWIDKKIWQKAIAARKQGNITTEQEILLYDGHWKTKK